ncbi:hypothetical protein AMK10_22990 [Streptomyces sp. CB02058]|nr:hypothetical protein AMK10_22990 [Streptomyces sp. CB02058]
MVASSSCCFSRVSGRKTAAAGRWFSQVMSITDLVVVRAATAGTDLVVVRAATAGTDLVVVRAATAGRRQRLRRR